MKKILKLILLLTLAYTASAQPLPNDCVNALTVCGNGTFSSNATGIGNTQEVNGCGGFEHNSLWLKINIVQGGKLGFNLIPDDPNVNVDYDFWVFGPNANCGSLGSPIRCNTINPLLAGTPNITGMNGSTTVTQAGPGAGTAPNNTGYVRWLDVLPGQSYYIAIDRPVGDGGFQLQWIGTAMAGTGAFPASPAANSIPDLLTCSNTLNVGIYDLNTVRSLINPDTSSNTISFHATQADAVDNVNALGDIYSNTSNPQTICARVTNNVSGCYNTTCFNLVVNLVPTVSISISNPAICVGDNTTVTFTGTPNATFDYTIDAGPTQTAVLNATGTYTITESPTSNRVYKLTGVRMLDSFGVTICSQTLNQTVSVSVTALPTATISGTTGICPGNTAPITFNGTPNAIISYTVDGGPIQSIVLNASGTATLTTPVLNANSVYALVSATTAGAPGCSQTQTGTATVTINALPTASIAGTTTICSGATATISFTGTPNATVTYSVDGGPNQTILLNGSGTAAVTTPILTSNSTYSLVNATFAGASGCTQTITGSAVITVQNLPTASISGSTTICSGGNAVVTFSGTPNATVTYNLNGGINQNIVLNGAGTATLSVSSITSDHIYNLVSVATSGSPACTKILAGSITITINALPTANISGSTEVCPGGTAVITFSGSPNATVTYNIDGGTNQNIILNATGTATITTAVLFNPTTYNLVSATAAGTLPCSQNLTGAATVNINALPTVTISGTTTICPGDIANITFTGTPNATVTYNIDGGSNQTAVLNGAGVATVTTPSLLADSTYNLVSIALPGVSACSQAQSGSATITVNGSLSAAISGSATICSGTTTVITFNGTPNAAVAYNVNGGTDQIIVLNNSGSATLVTPILTADSIYNLVSVSTGGGSCTLTVLGSAIITVKPLPAATISGTVSICPGNSAQVTFNGTPNATINYTVDGGVSQTIVLNAAGTAVLTTPALTSTSSYNLLSVTSAGTPVCSQSQTGSATITVIPLPTAAISGTTTLCAGNSTLITFTGTPNATVTYTVNGGANQNITLNAAGIASLTTPVLTSSRTYDLVSVASAGTPSCSQIQTGSAAVTIIPLPTATISGTASVCANSAGNSIVMTGANGTAPYTFTYSINGIVQPPVTSNSSNSATVAINTANSGTYIYSLISVQSSGVGSCSQSQTGTATVTVNQLPNATMTASAPSACLNAGLTVTLSGSLGTLPYIFVYTQNGTSHTVTSTGSNYVINVPTNSAGPVSYQLVSVTDSKGCSVGINQSTVVTVLTAPTVNTPAPYAMCANGINCFDLSTVVTPQVTTDPTLTVTYHATQANAETGASPLASPYCIPNSPTTRTVYIRVFDPNAPACYTLTTVQLIVNPKPQMTLVDGHICVDPITGLITGTPYHLTTGLSTNVYSFRWFDQNGQITSATNSFYNASVPGQYFVEVTHTATGCSSVSNTATVEPSSPPQQITYTTSGYFAENANVVITATPAGNYEYQLDNGPFQASNTFGNISAGPHTIHVRDVYGCDMLEAQFRIIDYPKYFTPNGDGIHDLWNISLGPGTSSLIRIFDRYGKLVKQISPNDYGWDGTYNGALLPSTDYWFTIDYVEEAKPKQFGAHFSLKR